MSRSRSRHDLWAMSFVTIEQAAFSLSNMALAFGISRAGGLEGVGEFGVAIAASIVGANIFRAVVSEPALLSGNPGEWWQAIRALVKTEIAVGVFLAAHWIAAGSSVLFVALAMFGAQIIVEVFRLWAISTGRSPMLILLDVLWLFCVAVPAFLGGGADIVVAGWCIGAVLAGTIGLFIMIRALEPAPAATSDKNVRRDLLVIYLSSGFIIQLAAAVIAALDTTLGGAYRIGQTLLGPSRFVIQGIRMGLVSKARETTRSPKQVASALSGIATTAVVVGVIVVWVMLGVDAFGPFGISQSSELGAALLFLGADRAMVALGVGPAVVLRANGSTAGLRNASLAAGSVSLLYIAASAAALSPFWLQAGPLVASALVAILSCAAMSTDREPAYAV